MLRVGDVLRVTERTSWDSHLRRPGLLSSVQHLVIIVLVGLLACYLCVGDGAVRVLLPGR